MKLATLLVFGPLGLLAGLAPDSSLSAGRASAERTALPQTAPAGEFASPPYDLSSTGIEWNKGLASVVGRDKPILLFQLLGDFERVHC